MVYSFVGYDTNRTADYVQYLNQQCSCKIVYLTVLFDRDIVLSLTECLAPVLQYSRNVLVIIGIVPVAIKFLQPEGLILSQFGVN